MLQWVDSNLWDLFFLAATLIMLGFADYSRNLATQKSAAYLFLGFVVFHFFSRGDFALVANIGIDLIGIYYVGRFWLRDRSQLAPLWVANLFGMMLALHVTVPATGLFYSVSLNLLYLTQLVILAIFGFQHGRAARIFPTEARNDPYYKVRMAGSIWLKGKTQSNWNAG